MGITRWCGSKDRMRSVINSYLQPLLDTASSFHDVTVGGGSILCEVARRYPDLPLHANDADPGVAALWSVVSGPLPDVRRLE